MTRSLAPLLARAAMVQARTREFWSSDDGARATVSGRSAENERIGLMTVGTAPLYAVSTDLVDLLEIAMLDVPAFVPIETDLRTPDGFAVFERPLTVGFYDDGGGPVVVDGLMWITSRLEFQTTRQIAFGYLTTTTTLNRRFVAGLAAMQEGGEFFGARFGEPWGDKGPHTERLVDRSSLMRAWVRLLNERIAVSRRVDDLPRSARRQALREGIDPDTASVWLLREPLQRVAEESADYRRLKNRHIVQPHWHPYWHGAGADRRLVPHLLDAYVKGPPDAPLVVRQRVGAVVR